MQVIVRLSIVVFVSACGASSGPPGGDGGGGGLDGGDRADGALPPRDGGGTALDAGTDARIDRVAFCMGQGPAVIVGDATASTDTCAGAIASRVFSNSICSCTDANVAGYMRTRSFDSGMGMSDTAAGAPVGINRDYTTGGYADVGGTFTVAGGMGVRFAGYLEVGGDARFGGDVNAISYIRVRRDLWVQGNVTNVGLLTIDGDLHQPSGRTLATIPDIDGSTIRTPFTIDPPCACAAADLVDIDAIVRHAAIENDNADVGLDPSLLSQVAGLGVDITLPCGRYYLSSIGGLGSITVHVPGRTALFVDGDVNALGVFDIDLGPEGELDMFVRGNLLSIGAGSYGDRSRAAATRIYVGGTGDVTLVGASGFVGNVYAPRARVTAVGATTVYGSLFGRAIDMPGYLDVHYDRAILEVDRDCPPPDACGCGAGEGCTDHRACIGGACAACTSDNDCCAPLVCHSNGTCGSLLF
ncbi:MAG: hypothetical protein IT378_24915 [Sandaracinaceae bacterium]|nr:hypothetical protein [Sandaracinaceae bacterium]